MKGEWTIKYKMQLKQPGWLLYYDLDFPKARIVLWGLYKAVRSSFMKNHEGVNISLDKR